MLAATLSIAALAVISAAIDNMSRGLMSQGLCMFDAQGRIMLRNQRYLDMYKCRRGRKAGLHAARAYPAPQS